MYGIICIFPHPTVGVCRVSECVIHSTAWHGMYIPTFYVYSHFLLTYECANHRGLVFIGCVGVCRVSENLIDSTAWVRMYILTPFSPASDLVTGGWLSFGFDGVHVGLLYRSFFMYT